MYVFHYELGLILNMQSSILAVCIVLGTPGVSTVGAKIRPCTLLPLHH